MIMSYNALSQTTRTVSVKALKSMLRKEQKCDSLYAAYKLQEESITNLAQGNIKLLHDIKDLKLANEFAIERYEELNKITEKIKKPKNKIVSFAIGVTVGGFVFSVLN